MENTLATISQTLPTFVQNTHFNITLEGWPAAITFIVLCCSGVAIHALNVTHPEKVAVEGGAP